MSEPSDLTKADLEKALNVLSAILADRKWETAAAMDALSHIAGALADEREKARAPFLDLLQRTESYWAKERRDFVSHRHDFLKLDDLRRAAEVTP